MSGNTESCVACGHTAELIEEEREVVVRNRTARVPEQFWRCSSCGEEHLSPEQMRAAQERAVRAIRAEEGLLQADEISTLRHALGLTQAEFELLLGVGPKTVVRWERGTVFQSRAMDTLLRVLRDHPEVSRSLVRERGLATA